MDTVLIVDYASSLNHLSINTIPPTCPISIFLLKQQINLRKTSSLIQKHFLHSQLNTYTITITMSDMETDNVKVETTIKVETPAKTSPKRTASDDEVENEVKGKKAKTNGDATPKTPKKAAAIKKAATPKTPKKAATPKTPGKTSKRIPESADDFDDVDRLIVALKKEGKGWAAVDAEIEKVHSHPNVGFFLGLPRTLCLSNLSVLN